MDLTTLTEPGDGYVTVLVGGEIDLHSAQVLRDAALAALREHGPTLRLDLGDVTFMDSTGIEVLMATRRRAELDGGSLTLCRPNRAVRRVLEVTGLDQVFTIEPDQPAATV